MRGALELPVRIDEMLPIQNRHIDWRSYQVQVGWLKTGAVGRLRWAPFDPEGELAKIFERRKKLGLNAYVFGTIEGKEVSSIQDIWDELRLVALCGLEPQRSYIPSKKPSKRHGKKQASG